MTFAAQVLDIVRMSAGILEEGARRKEKKTNRPIPILLPVHSAGLRQSLAGMTRSPFSKNPSIPNVTY